MILINDMAQKMVLKVEVHDQQMMGMNTQDNQLQTIHETSMQGTTNNLPCDQTINRD